MSPTISNLVEESLIPATEVSQLPGYTASTPPRPKVGGRRRDRYSSCACVSRQTIAHAGGGAVRYNVALNLGALKIDSIDGPCRYRTIQELTVACSSSVYLVMNASDANSACPRLDHFNDNSPAHKKHESMLSYHGGRNCNAGEHQRGATQRVCAHWHVRKRTATRTVQHTRHTRGKRERGVLTIMHATISHQPSTIDLAFLQCQDRAFHKE